MKRQSYTSDLTDEQWQKTNPSKFGFIIPNYNGIEMLNEYLPGIDKVAGEADVLVVDDASYDNSVQVLRDNFPGIRVIVREKNGGFSAAVNDGIRATGSDFVVLLNSDVEVTPGFLEPIIPLFDDKSVFAVSPRIILPKRGGIDEGAKTGFWHHGLFFTDQRSDIKEVSPVLYATGCAAVYRRSMLEALGGFDEAYSPFYWEDADLGYRAWKRGWKSLYQPSGTVYHQHSASISKIKSDVTQRIRTRNSLFFIWRNIEDRDMLRTHSRWLPLILARKWLAGDLAFIRGWRDAYAHRKEAIEARRQDSEHRVLSDREIFSINGINF